MRYTVRRHRLTHNQRRYPPGSAVELTPAEAEPLLAIGAIAPARKRRARKQGGGSRDATD